VTFHFEQIFRTPASEQWSVIRDAGSEEEASLVAGRVDVHFDTQAGASTSRVTVVLRDDLGDDGATEVLTLVDEQLIPAKARGDVRITLWRGAHAGTFVPEDAS
jgi:hypothetical protein